MNERLSALLPADANVDEVAAEAARIVDLPKGTRPLRRTSTRAGTRRADLVLGPVLERAQDRLQRAAERGELVVDPHLARAPGPVAR